MIRLLILDFNNQQILDYNSLMQTQKKAKIRSWLCGLKTVFHFNRILAKRVFYCVHIISSARVFTKQLNTLCFATIHPYRIGKRALGADYMIPLTRDQMKRKMILRY